MNSCIPFCCNSCHFAAVYALKPLYYNTCADLKGGGGIFKRVPHLPPPWMGKNEEARGKGGGEGVKAGRGLRQEEGEVKLCTQSKHYTRNLQEIKIVWPECASSRHCLHTDELQSKQYHKHGELCIVHVALVRLGLTTCSVVLSAT